MGQLLVLCPQFRRVRFHKRRRWKTAACIKKESAALAVTVTGQSTVVTIATGASSAALWNAARLCSAENAISEHLLSMGHGSRRWANSRRGPSPVGGRVGAGHAMRMHRRFAEVRVGQGGVDTLIESGTEVSN